MTIFPLLPPQKSRDGEHERLGLEGLDHVAGRPKLQGFFGPRLLLASARQHYDRNAPGLFVALQS